MVNVAKEVETGGSWGVGVTQWERLVSNPLRKVGSGQAFQTPLRNMNN